MTNAKSYYSTDDAAKTVTKVQVSRSSRHTRKIVALKCYLGQAYKSTFQKLDPRAVSCCFDGVISISTHGVLARRYIDSTRYAIGTMRQAKMGHSNNDKAKQHREA